MPHKNAVRILAAAAGAAMAGVALMAGPVQAAPTTAPQPGAKYVALGSSYAAGANVGPADPTDGGQCGRTLSAYPSLVAKALDLNLASAACGGATTENITTAPQKVGTRTLGLQIDAVGADTDLVTITIGGNDVSYVKNLIAESCIGDLAANPSSPLSNYIKPFGLCIPTSDDAVLAALAPMESKLTQMVQSVQAKAPHARIVLVDYPTVLPEDGQPCASIPIIQDRQKFLLDVARELSLATKHAAQKTGAEFVAASKESRQHDACSSDPWMTGYALAPGVSAMHPTAAGHAAVAAAVVKQLTNPGAAS